MKTLIVVDCQNDFISGSLACLNAEEAVEYIVKYINDNDVRVVYLLCSEALKTFGDWMSSQTKLGGEANVPWQRAVRLRNHIVLSSLLVSLDALTWMIKAAAQYCRCSEGSLPALPHRRKLRVGVIGCEPPSLLKG